MPVPVQLRSLSFGPRLSSPGGSRFESSSGPHTSKRSCRRSTPSAVRCAIFSGTEHCHPVRLLDTHSSLILG
jgi:hypothetical protein